MCEQISACDVKIAIGVSKGTFWWFFWKHEIYFTSYLERKGFGLLAAGFSKHQPTSPGKHFPKHFFKKWWLLTIFSTSSKKVTAGFSKLRFTCVGEQFAKTFFKNFWFSSFCTLSEKFSKFGEKKLDVSKLPFGCPEERLEEILKKMMIFM